MNPNDATLFAGRAHHGQAYGTRPYLEHVADVAGRVMADDRANDDAIVVAWLHDVLEDTSASKRDLQAAGITPRQLRALLHLTRHKGEDYSAYIGRVAQDEIAVLVKWHDLHSNQAMRPRPDLAERYAAAIQRLAEVVEWLDDVA